MISTSATALHKTRIYVVTREPGSTFRAYEIVSSSLLDTYRLERLAQTLFVDSVCEQWQAAMPPAPPLKTFIVWYKDGVYDGEGDMALYAAKRMGQGQGIEKIKFGRGHWAHVPAPGIWNPLVEKVEIL